MSAWSCPQNKNKAYFFPFNTKTLKSPHLILGRSDKHKSSQDSYV